MKNILRDQFGKFKSLKIDVLDGQKKWEVIFRRVFVLLVGALIIYLLLLAFVGKKDQNVPEVQADEEKAQWEGDQKIEYDDNGKKWYIHEEYNNYVPPVEVVEEVPEVPGKGVIDDSIRQYIKSYGGKIDDGYLSLLREYCDGDTLKVVVAISVAETGMGKNTNKQSNYWGWHLGGDSSYDPGLSEMAQEICRGINKSYMSIGYNRAVTEAYTGGDRVETWINNYKIAFESM